MKLAINLRTILIQSIKLPILLLILGGILSLLVCVEPFCNPHTYWRTVFNIANDLGNVLMTLSWVIFLYLAVISILKAYEKILSGENKKTATHILTTIRKGSRIIFVFFALHAIFTVFEVKYQYPNIFHKITAIFIIAAFAWVFLQIIGALEIVFYKIRQVRNIASFLVIAIAVSAILMLFDPVRNVGISILASATFLTAIVAFSAQKTLGSMFAGVQLAFSKRIQIGDALTIENENGIVEEITLSYVIVKISDSRRLIFPVSYFLEKPIHNWSLNNEQLQASIRFYVDFLFPIEELRTELNRLLAASTFWNKKIGMLTVSNIKENAVELRVAVSANNFDDLDNLKVELREKLLYFIAKNYPQHLPRLRLNGDLTS